MNALIFAGGVLPSRALVKKLALSSNVVLCADGGTRNALRCGVQPDIVIGDLDSLSRNVRRRLKRAIIIRSRDQNRTDLEKALLYLIRRKVRRITILGATGKRIDQTIANILLLQKYHKKAKLTMIDPTGAMEIVDSEVTLHARVGETVSLLAIGRAAGVTTKGLLYPLRNETLEAGSRGVSNRVTSGTVEIRVRRGKLLLVKLFGK